MKNLRNLILCCLTVLVAGAGVTGSAAASLPLFLKTEGTFLPNGSSVEGLLNLNVPYANLCQLEFLGTVTANGQPTDLVTFTAFRLFFCELGGHSGSLERFELTSKGKLTIKAHPALTVEARGPGGIRPCVYEVSTLRGKFTPSGRLYPGIPVSGKYKLNREASLPSCPTKASASGYAFVRDSANREYLEAET